LRYEVVSLQLTIVKKVNRFSYGFERTGIIKNGVVLQGIKISSQK
jgi:hypothetical protein